MGSFLDPKTAELIFQISAALLPASLLTILAIFLLRRRRRATLASEKERALAEARLSEFSETDRDSVNASPGEKRSRKIETAQLTRRAEAFLSRGDLEEAEKLLIEALSLAPEDLTTKNLLAEISWQRGAVEKTRLLTEQILEQEPGNFAGNFLRGKVALAEGAVELAVKCLSASTGKNSKNPEHFLLLGRAFSAAGKSEEARAAFEKSLALAPRDKEILLTMIKHFQQQEPAELGVFLRRAKELHSHDRAFLRQLEELSVGADQDSSTS